MSNSVVVFCLTRRWINETSSFKLWNYNFNISQLACIMIVPIKNLWLNYLGADSLLLVYTLMSGRIRLLVLAFKENLKQTRGPDWNPDHDNIKKRNNLKCWIKVRWYLLEGNIKGKLACLNLEVAQFLMLNLNGKHV